MKQFKDFIEEAVDPSEVAGNPKAYDAKIVKAAYYHKKASDNDKKALARHLDSYHGPKEWRKSVKEEVLDVASTYKKIAVRHLKDMMAKDSTKANKDYARKMHQRALEASKMSNHTDALNHYRGMKEEIEQIDEISQATKDSYAKKAESEVKQLKSHVKGEYGGIVKRMIARRNKGLELARKKMSS